MTQFKKETKIQKNYMIYPSLFNELEELSKKTGVSISRILEVAVKKVLVESKSQKMLEDEGNEKG